MKKTTEWDAALTELAEWFQSGVAEATLPAEPFQLNPWTRVAEPQEFYRALKKDIELGPGGYRAKVLSDDLSALRRCVTGT